METTMNSVLINPFALLTMSFQRIKVVKPL
jgi:hypothetical protein